MNPVPFLLSLCLAVSVSLQAQQSMPGMTMPRPPSVPQSTPAASKPNRTPEQAVPPSTDLKHAGPGDPAAKKAAASEQQSAAQQRAQSGAEPDDRSDHRSLMLPFEQMQEPEAAGFQTGSDLSAPDLLGDVAGREPLSLDRFLQMADSSNPTLAEAQRNVERSQQQARQAGLPPDPIVGYSGDQIRGGSYHGGEEGAFFSQEFVLGRKLALRRNVYRAEGKANDYAVQAQRARVHDDVAQAFIGTLTAQEEVAVQDRLLKVALDAETNAHELERVGQNDASDVLTAEIASEQAKIDFVQTQRTYLASFSQLATLSGQTSLPPHPLTGNLLEPPAMDAEVAALIAVEQSPEVKQAQAAAEAAEAGVVSARREKIPNLNVKAGEWYSGEELGATTVRSGFESFAEVGVQIPLWNRNQGNTGAAQAEVERAREDVLRVQLQTRRRAEPLAQQYQTARFTAERFRVQMIPRARRAYQLEVLKYQQMALSYPHVLLAQHLLYTLQLGYLHALNDEWRAALALQNYTLMNGLDAPVSTGEDTSTINLPASSR
jgi:cobalt-zinc-cadmium efflux system outer membrane protein